MSTNRSQTNREEILNHLLISIVLTIKIHYYKAG